MIFGRGYGRAGDELTWKWLNSILKMARTNQLFLGINSGLSMQKVPGMGTYIAVSAPPQGVFLCQPGSAVAGATGAWPTITPTGFTADVYQVSGSGLSLYMASAQCYNWYAAGLDDDKTVTLLPDGSGAFVAIAQSCT